MCLDPAPSEPSDSFLGFQVFPLRAYDELSELVERMFKLIAQTLRALVNKTQKIKSANFVFVVRK